MYKYLPLSSLTATLFICLVMISCGEDRTLDLDDSLLGREYFPSAEGRTWLYQVDSTIVDDAGATIVSSRSYVREEIVDSFTNTLGQLVYIINRSYSEERYGEYKVMDAWTMERTDKAAIRTEENLRFVKLLFPISEGATWNGNQFDELTLVDVAGESIWVYKDWGDYTIDQSRLTLTVAGETFKNVIRVEQADFESDIELRQAREYYAPGVGMIKKHMTILDTQCLCPGESWDEKAEAGFILDQVLLEYY